MSYFIAYVVAEDGPPLDGKDIAATKGWYNWGTWVLDRPEAFPQLAHLAQEGWNEGDGVFDAMEHECERMMKKCGDKDLRTITRRLLAGLRARPQETLSVIITDGEPGDDEEEDDE